MRIEDLKLLIQQFEVFLPEDQRRLIQQILADIEASGGIKDDEHGQQLLAQLMQIVNLGGK